MVRNYQDYEFVANSLAVVSPDQYAPINETLEQIGANLRIGPPVIAGCGENPSKVRQTGLFFHKDVHPEKDKSRTVCSLEKALRELQIRLGGLH